MVSCEEGSCVKWLAVRLAHVSDGWLWDWFMCQKAGFEVGSGVRWLAVKLSHVSAVWWFMMMTGCGEDSSRYWLLDWSSLCWILLLVWSLAWSALITLHLPWWICIGCHTRSALHTNCVWSCLSACVVLPLLIWLTIALVLLWCLVYRLWDLLLMVTFLVIGLTGVWDLLRWRAPAVGMLCLLVWGLPLLV